MKLLKDLLTRYEAELNEAIYQDLHKSTYETFLTELMHIHVEIKTQLKNIKRWSRRKRVRGSLFNLPGKSYIQPTPYGVCLILSPWNYPYQLSLVPAVDALSAGNTVILKPSELAPHTSSAIARLINDHFPPEVFHVIEGDGQVATQLLEYQWDKIFFTGSPRIGRKVMESAARHLTPVTLELGGKSPALISESTDPELAARRLVWGKFINAGQTCIAPDYVLVHESIEQALLDNLTDQIKKQFTRDRMESHYVRIINEPHYDRLIAYLSQGKIVTGGYSDPESRLIHPTVLTEVKHTDPVLEEEIFGPILPVIPVPDWETAIDWVRSRPHPLALYVFSNRKEEIDRARDHLQFGGMTINDTLHHISNTHLPFGGVGTSGMGHYHGKWGFDTFSHQKAIQTKARWIEPPFKYPPYTDQQESLLKKWFK